MRLVLPGRSPYLNLIVTTPSIFTFFFSWRMGTKLLCGFLTTSYIYNMISATLSFIFLFQKSRDWISTTKSIFRYFTFNLLIDQPTRLTRTTKLYEQVMYINKVMLSLLGTGSMGILTTALQVNYYSSSNCSDLFIMGTITDLPSPCGAVPEPSCNRLFKSRFPFALRDLFFPIDFD